MCWKARGGSKGLPRKNALPLGGKPLLVWAVEQALAAATVDRVVVSTDDPELAELGRSAGAEVLLRPAELAADDTPDLPVLRHVLAELDEEPEVVVWLRPTSPLRLPEDVDGAVELLVDAGVRCVRSVCAAEHHPAWMYTLGPAGELAPLDPVAEATILTRQQLPEVVRPNGAVEVIRADALPESGPLFAPPALGYVMPAERSVDIDSELDLALAELLLGRRSG